MYAIDHFLIIASLLLFISILASKVSAKLGVPILFFFLLIGILASDDYLALFPFRSLEGTKALGVVTVVFVLFLGGLETDFAHIRPIWKGGALLSTVATVLTALLVGYFLQWITKGALSLAESTLVGTIIASTDAAAVFSILRANNIHLKHHLGPLLEIESGTNDVMVYFLMTCLIRFIQDPTTHFYTALPIFFQEMIIGGLGGILVGYTMLFVTNQINLKYLGLYSPLNLSLIFLGYAFVNVLHGSGFLAVYIAGMILGNHNFVHRKSLLGFYKGMSWLMQIVMFIALGLLVTPQKIWDILPWAIALAIFLLIIGRPVAVYVALYFLHFDWKQKLFIAWGGLRGGVPIIFATYLYNLRTERAHIMFHLIFFVVLVSIVVQGSTLVNLAKLLQLEAKKKSTLRAFPFKEEEQESKKKNLLIELEVPKDSPAVGKSIVSLDFPQNAFITLIYRDRKYLTVHGRTIIVPKDKLLVIFDAKKDLKAVKFCLGIK